MYEKIKTKKISKLYKYVGAEEIRQKTAHLAPGNKVLSINDIENWIKQSK